MDLDVPSVRRMVEHHVRLGVQGLFLAGSNGEGPWMTDSQRGRLVQAARRYARGRLVLAVQVTDNSAARILENMHAAKADGADIAVIAPPYFHMRATPAAILDLYRQAIRQSPLPVGVYDRGRHSPVFVPPSVLGAIYAEPQVILVKDSSTDPTRRRLALEARKRRPSLRLLTGYEFDCVSYLQAGYDGLLLGGGAFNGHLAGQIVQAVAAGQIALARRLQGRMNRIMYAVYGGRRIACWLAGEKELLVKMGIFRTWRNYLGYTLTASCRRAIRRVLKADKDVLWPQGR
jgi:4-hydroxy-tetrahydrodipicolinate synthase